MSSKELSQWLGKGALALSLSDGSEIVGHLSKNDAGRFLFNRKLADCSHWVRDFLDEAKVVSVRTAAEVSGDDDYWVNFFDAPGLKRQNFLIRLSAAITKHKDPIDDLAVVVVAGTFFEFYVRQLIASKSELNELEPNGKAPLEFAVLVRVGRSTGVLPEHLASALLKFAHVRNGYAHDIEHAIVRADRDKLSKVLSAKDSELVQDVHAKFLLQGMPDASSTYVRAFIAWLGDELEAEIQRLMPYNGSP